MDELKKGDYDEYITTIVAGKNKGRRHNHFVKVHGCQMAMAKFLNCMRLNYGLHPLALHLAQSKERKG